jgi:hypothetical protein
MSEPPNCAGGALGGSTVVPGEDLAHPCPDQESCVSSRHRPPTSAPLSTKIAVGLGLLLVGGGFALAGWQRLTGDDSTDAAPPTGTPHQYLPSVETVVAYAAAIVTVVIAGGYVLVRARRHRSGL